MSKSAQSKRRSDRVGTQRTVGALLAVVTAAAALVVGWPQLIGLERALFVAQAVSFRVPVIIGSVALLLVVLLVMAGSRGARRVLAGTAVVLAVLIVSTGTLVASRGLGAPNIPAEHADEDIRVLSWNTRGDEPGSPTIANLALSLDADVVVLPETTEGMGVEIATLMAEAGRPMWVHTRTIDEEYKATATTLLISPELGDYVVVTDEGDTSTLPTVIARPIGDGPTIIAAHPVSPTPANMDDWRSDLEWLAGTCTGSTIVAGDFNATVDHLTGLGAEGDADFTPVLGECADAALATGNGSVGTWTAGVPPVIGTQIDHVMATRDWAVTGFEVITDHDRAGSDHRPVFAQLSRV
ncbi:endonuclease/exonuclease/phosphatase family protein [Pseudoclavibacter chungangensis]|uniref:Endonuclease/exonuclease/phosphatase family protein n=1 Tax=Pseudoclavibacter chungangensis TaxID=587635 RepID=A0A7J5BPL3_9MICO|nr:endonuclease/exonuclease/phosphatase family protein [Pseudoclavibacter chungangensis]KAB1655112.1 endonuclease/exonuclease/phosphatase family protein [Pseudoclavibacter chungangensis]NYJ66116.1 endonuclease/exonuclease/phosphatase (EEP) superfamily protein YafD [Pseudoclavibacter chungangensis]